MASTPTYNPSLVEGHFGQIARSAKNAKCGSPAPLVNRATDGLFVPGSTFKIVTAAAALDSGAYTADSTFDDKGYCEEYGKKVSNFADQSGPEVFGHVDFTTALEHSINAVFCEIGKKLGPLKLLEYAKRFGFYKDPPLETPSTERIAERPVQPRAPLSAARREPGRPGPARLRAGATPGHAAADGDGRRRDRQRRHRDAAVLGREDHRPRRRHRLPHPPTRALEGDLAADGGDADAMMEKVVQSGTGTAAQIPGVPVAGKTGTAETGVNHVNTTSFVAFAPADAPKVAVAVYLENQHGVGGQTAAPIAKQIMEALLRGRP